MTFQSVSDFICKEQYLTMQLKSEQFQSSLKNTDGINMSVIFFVIDIMNNVREKWTVYQQVYKWIW
jgi:hypothetical protein